MYRFPFPIDFLFVKILNPISSMMDSFMARKYESIIDDGSFGRFTFIYNVVVIYFHWHR